MCFGNTLIWTRRWLGFFIVLIAFVAAMVVAYTHQGVEGRIGDKNGACLYVSGNSDGWTLYRGAGAECKKSGAVLMMEEDKLDSPIIFTDPATGALLCVTNRQGDDSRVTLEPCASEQQDQQWTSKNGHIHSEVARKSGNVRECLSGPTSVASVNRQVVMAECKAKPAQLWSFVPS